MGSEEKKIRERYSQLAAELGDVVTKIRLSSRRQAEIEREIDALNASMAAAQAADKATAAPSVEQPG